MHVRRGDGATTTGDAQSEVMGLLRGVLVAMHAAATAAASGTSCGHNGVAALGHLALEKRVQAVVRKPLLDRRLLELVHVRKAPLHYLAQVHCVVGCGDSDSGSGDDSVGKDADEDLAEAAVPEDAHGGGAVALAVAPPC